LISVLESSPTRRDTKAYLQAFGDKIRTPTPKDKIRAVTEAPRFFQGPPKEAALEANDAPHVAIVKLRNPQDWDESLVNGVAKTLTQLRDLGLASVLVPDCADSSRQQVLRQVDRITRAIGQYGSPGARLVSSWLWSTGETPQNHSSITPSRVFVGLEESFTVPLRHGHILVVPPHPYLEDTSEHTVVAANDIVLALTSFFSGLQFDNIDPRNYQANHKAGGPPIRKAVVDRVIVIDPFGGIPSIQEKEGARVFVNLEEEFGRLQDILETQQKEMEQSGDSKVNHLDNLRLVKSALAILPSAASAVLTSPTEAANLRLPQIHGQGFIVNPVTGDVGTRRWQNPLIHNLLTDRPIYSSSLPLGRIIKSRSLDTELAASRMPTTTLAKKGMPVTIFPDPRKAPWRPPKPGGPRLRLTDTCIDLPRLVHLINDSFGRTLDVKHYLNRVQESLAGIIIAGEYEGGAILTWERPLGMDEQTAFGQGRLVPYLDKFAVLKRSQGAGGVADIVFNAMVRDCFPAGVCWRSRKNNPVNKWYFERSAGVWKLTDSNWAMFWTSPSASPNKRQIGDYESVCRNVEPSWADGKQAD